MNSLSWLTPAGFIFTATESVFTSTTITAISTSSAVNFNIISGLLPQGLNLTTSGVISGIPENVLSTTRNTFIVRANDNSGFSDREFFIDVEGADNPIWNTITITTSTSGSLTTSTTEGYLPLGFNQEPYIIDKQWVDFQLSASLVEAPTTASVKFYILPGDGILPPGLELTESGRLYGIVNTESQNLSQNLNCFSNVIENLNDYITTSTSNASQYISDNFKIYNFFITAFDGFSAEKRKFSILIINPNIFRASSTALPTSIDILSYLNIPCSVSFLPPPQNIKNNYLGKIKVGNNTNLPINSYVFNPLIGNLTYQINTLSNTIISLPNNLTLNENFGYISGFVDFQTEYIKDYSVTINVTNTAINYRDVITATNTFTFTVQNGIDNVVFWKTDNFLGTLTTQEISELFVEAGTNISNLPIKYEIKNGSLPTGLNLNEDGTISGLVDVNTNFSSTSTLYTFNIAVTDNNKNEFINKDFSISVNQTTSTEYTNIWCRPYLKESDRKLIRDFLSNTDIFIPDLIYRPRDSYFGIQKNLKMMIHYGIEKENLSDYVDTISQNFSRKKFYFGKIKSAISINDNKEVYELIYIDILDKLINDQNQSISLSFTFNGRTYFPTTVENMRTRLESLHNNTSNFDPKFTKTILPNTVSEFGFIKFIPLCFIKPGNSNLILRKIQDSKFKFNVFDFEVDRIIFQSTRDFQTNKYLLFRRI